ncbi:DEAD/DEAH box helicase [Lactobacillus delbrueckii]|uniref:DEAD/DEAH box helicase n=1 Tax=Lactobacillus delbrueckii TaxID=1584 RepID=UPI001E395D32|nr:DEAD/DEAH box helicase family protein [Lactobacillus delbrueckii]MCD5543678.1 DEAD/DEAH box helicase family protein [Lactobacillus delbrueckii subsp. lactis]
MSNNIVEINYHQTGKSTNTDELGMREMQAKVYAKRQSQYLLVKAPPASGKSRALMFVALDKLANQGVKKVIVAVPEKSIGKSFKNTELSKYGFYEDWIVDPQYDLTLPGGDKGKVDKLVEFLHNDDPEARIAICTHATLRFAYQRIEDDRDFDDVMVAIDEFHHVSADDSSVLGTALKNILHNSTAHIFTMTGSYFRGDSAPILTAEDEALFDKVTYTYYEQLDGYQYLKSFGIDYKFYQGTYLDALPKALDTTKKTIIHIPNVNSGESTKDKYGEVDQIFDVIGTVVGQDENTGIYTIKDKETGQLLKVADLVNEDGRERVQEYLRNMTAPEDLDIIIALGMAKEGFDWPYAEQALTIGYRHSLTEVVQIIGRVTRDSSNKTHSQFTNLIEQPDAKNSDVEYAVNQILKAITASLLMEQVMAPQIHLKPRKKDEPAQSSDGNGTSLRIKGLHEITSDKVRDILENDMNDLQAAILQDAAVKKGIAGDVSAEIMNKELIPKVIMSRYPDLSDEEVEEVRQYTVAQTNLQHAETESTVDEQGNTNDFLKMADKFINIDDLDINLIDQINPFQRAYDVISQNIDSSVLRTIENMIDAKKYEFDDDELVYLYPQIKKFMFEHNGQEPSKDSRDELEVKMAYALSTLRIKFARKRAENESED